MKFHRARISRGFQHAGQGLSNLVITSRLLSDYSCYRILRFVKYSTELKQTLLKDRVGNDEENSTEKCTQTAKSSFEIFKETTKKKIFPYSEGA